MSKIFEDLEAPIDPGYRNFVAAVDKILKQFESTSEWQDLIASLGKLNKVLSTHGAKYHVIPRRVLVGKRLAQCMHPNLPSGVHLKAIETYDTIFKMIGSARLAQQLFIYSSGIFPLLPLAATSVRPSLLHLYEVHFVPLGHALKPGLPGLLAGTLPALEENSEHFDRIESFLEKAAEATGEFHFYSKVWEAISANPSVRRPALDFILSHFDKQKSLKEQSDLVGNNWEAMVHSLRSCLEDSSVLVQRAALEFMVVALPLAQCPIDPESTTLITASAVWAFLKRDMSLNRRLYAWLLGQDPNQMMTVDGKEQIEFFEQHSKSVLVRAIKMNIKQAPVDVKQYRILLSLLEKPEIGPEIIDLILVDILRSIHYATALSDETEEKIQEFLRTVSLLFHFLEPHYVWSFIADKFKEICEEKGSHSDSTVEKVKYTGEDKVSIQEMCILTEALLYSVELEKETLNSHLPRCCAEILRSITDYNSVITFQEIDSSVKLCFKIFEKMERSSGKLVTVADGEEELVQSSNDGKIPKLSEFRKIAAKLYSAFIDARMINERQSLDALEKTDGPDETDILLASVVTRPLCDSKSSRTKDCNVKNLEGKKLLNAKKESVLTKDLELSSHALAFNSFGSEECEACVSSYKTICELLLKLANYQLFPVTAEGERSWKSAKSNVLNISELPLWLQDLLRLSVSSNPVQICSIDLLLKFLRLTRTCQELSLHHDYSTELPMISIKEYLFLSTKTWIYKVLAKILWANIKTSSDKKLVSEAAYKLHGLIPIGSFQYMENEILTDFEDCSNSGHTDVLIHFGELWRHGQADEVSKPHRSFEKCLFRVFDFLSHPSCSVRQTTKSWLLDKIYKGDIARIFNPLLECLVGPSVVRRDPRATHIPQIRKITSNDQAIESKIRAIGSVNGDVTFYVSPHDKENSSLSRNSAEDAKFPDSKGVTFPWIHNKIVNEKLLRPVSMLVNPIESIEGVEVGQEAHLRSASVPRLNEEIYKRNKRRHSVGDASGFNKKIAPFPIEKKPHCFIEEVLNEVIESALTKVSMKPFYKPKDSVMNKDLTSASSEEKQINKFQDIRKSFGFVYTVMPDFQNISYALEVLCQVISLEPKIVLWSLTASAINKEQSKKLLSQLANYRINLIGRTSDERSIIESLSLFRSFMHLDAVLYSVLGAARTFVEEEESEEALQSNTNIQLKSFRALSLITRNLIDLIMNSNTGFVAYINDLYKRCKVHKIMLNTLFYQYQSDTMNCRSIISSGLEVLLQLVILDSTLEGIIPRKFEVPALKNNQYQPELPIYLQPVFITLFEQAFADPSFKLNYNDFVSFFIKCLPYLGSGLPPVTVFLFRELTEFLDEIMEFEHVNSDFEVKLLEALTIVTHYSLIGGSSSIPAAYGGAGSYRKRSESTEVSNSQILSNLLHAFSPGFKDDSVEASDPVLVSKKLLLANLSRLIQCALIIWQTAKKRPPGDCTVLRTKILELLGPISCNCLFSFLSAVALVWHDQKTKITTRKVTSIEVSSGQEDLVNMISSMKVLPPDTLISNVRNVFKNPPHVTGISPKFSLEVSLLQFLMAYLPKLSLVQLMEVQGSLFTLLNDAILFSPNAMILGLALLELIVTKVTVIIKTNQKDIQEAFSKLVEACLNVAGLCLEQTTWLRRNLAVKRNVQLPSRVAGNVLTSSLDEDEDKDESTDSAGSNPPSRSASSSALSSSVGQSAVTIPSGSDAGASALLALQALAEVFPSLLDMLYSGEERDKSTNILNSVMTVVVPYLRGHSFSTMGGHRCASQLLAGISNYQFTRRVWRKEVFDLLFEPNFFQMDNEAVSAWMKIIENLLVYEKSAFKELIARIPVGQAGLFTSKEADAENRAMLLKRLSFSIFCGNKDEFQHHMPEIQERLIDCLKLGQVLPSVQAIVFLCIRVLMVRMSDDCLISLWPTIITELVQSLSLMELELNRDTPEFSAYLSRLAALESTWIVGNTNLQMRNHPGWLQVYLQATKLLDLALCLPSEQLPQFQLYRWAFVGTGDCIPQNGPIDSEYVPHARRIAKSMRSKVKEDVTISAEPGSPILHSHSIKTLLDLYPFYKLVSQPEFLKLNLMHSTGDNASISKSLLIDFIEYIE
ncbi:protein dopey-1-like isoform X2 [Artemia franciscana]|uniref:Dopey N-terminal domain-containing protein n=1 Tax=Artemia franciscana TaxID=6661 RepID=A0AA88I5T0_ARTSF|nr:hypothetical protein QYM36_010462 [Artemia franciscana]